MKTQKSPLAKAIGMMREYNQLRKSALACKGFQSGVDRTKAADELYGKILLTLGRITRAQYSEWVLNPM